MRARARPWIGRLAAAALALLGAACATASPPLRAQITPAPVQLVEAPGLLVVRNGLGIAAPPGDAPARRTAEILADLTARAGGPRLRVVEREGAIVLRRTPGLGPEAYRLEVTPAGAVVTASTDAGLFHGAMSVWQLVTADGGRIPSLRIEDAPRYGWRGLMLDSARHYQSPAFIRSLIDAMAAHKLNVLHWHLTDDQAWRLEIRKYPRLTEVGAWRVPAGEGPARDVDPATGSPRLYGGFYTQDEVRALVAYAAERQITILPEIEMPGHATAAVVAYPQLAATSSPPKAVPADWGIYPNLFATDEATFGFLQDVLDEVIALFPSTYIHVGGDEAEKHQWKESPAVQAQMRALGIRDEKAMQAWFTQRIEKHLASRGRRLIGWDEILDGELPPRATVMSWRGIAGALEAAKRGHDTVLSPAPILYFDNRQAAGPAEPPGRGWIISLKDVYAFDPAPPQLTPEQQGHIIGLQANLWTEHIRTEARAAHMLFPRALAVAEVGWSPAARRDWKDFATRVPAAVARLRALGFPAAQSPFDGKHTPTDPRRRDSRELKTCSNAITLALEDDAPANGPRAVFLTDIMNPCWIWSGAQLDGISTIEVDVGQLPFNYQIGEDIKKVTVPRPRTPEGELEVRVGGCKAEPAVVAPLKTAAANPAVTTLKVQLPPTAGAQDLCFTFTRPKIEPMWAVAAVRLLPGPAR
ncbi:beta-N-acetylhexosaminidase [Phenylobacterium sp.]|jgi:hexosaminidase|uniref:beta-N-acetylhexosaminidase n=1 Tax=Phenylobacterium sp. TaxID=1871053 RepID=UPI002F91D9D3